jgi:uncharacterized membrane protein (DUF373 family)
MDRRSINGRSPAAEAVRHGAVLIWARAGPDLSYGGQTPAIDLSRETMKILELIERVVIGALLILLFLGIFLGTIELGFELYQAVIAPPFLLITPTTLFRFFGQFLIILVGLELLKLLKLRFEHKEIRPELVFEIALIAICNEIVTYNQENTNGMIMIGTAALVTALSVSYYVFFRARRESETSASHADHGGKTP